MFIVQYQVLNIIDSILYRIQYELKILINTIINGNIINMVKFAIMLSLKLPNFMILVKLNNT